MEYWARACSRTLLIDDVHEMYMKANVILCLDCLIIDVRKLKGPLTGWFIFVFGVYVFVCV